MNTAQPIRTRRPPPELTGGPEFAIDVARLAADNHTENVKVLDLRGLSNLADFFVLGTGTSSRQIHAVVDLIRQHAKSLDRAPFGLADTQSATWILADYIDVVIHLFDAEHREYYDLDGLWGDAPEVDWREEEGAVRPPLGNDSRLGPTLTPGADGLGGPVADGGCEN